MPERDDALIREFVILRRGWGLDATDLRDRIGPVIASWCGLSASSTDRDARRLVRDAVQRASAELGEEDRLAINFALGIARGSQLPRLQERVRLLAENGKFSERTARRRVDRAFERLAEEVATKLELGANEDDPDKGWSVRRFKALVRLDKADPELIEERVIVAARDGLRQISARFSIPRIARQCQAEPGKRQVSADVLFGATIEHQERLGDGHFYYLLGLPRTLYRDEQHTYTMAFRIMDGQPIRTYYAFIPLISCEFFQVRVRFNPANPPRAVWQLNRVPQRVLADPTEPGPLLPLDRAGEVELCFTDLDRGYGYGLSWLLADGTP